MINFNDLVSETRPVSGTIVKEDLIYDTEKKNFILGSHIRNALGTNSMAYYRYTLEGQTSVVLVGTEDGILYKAKVRKADNTRMSRGATFSNTAFRETIEELYPDVTEFTLTSVEVSTVTGPAWTIGVPTELAPGLFTETESDEETVTVNEYALTD